MKGLIKQVYVRTLREIRAPSFAWAIFLLIITFMPLLTYGIDSLRNIFTINISELDYKIIVENEFIFTMKLVLPFCISLFFFILFSFVFFIFRDENRGYFFHFYPFKQDTQRHSEINDKSSIYGLSYVQQSIKTDSKSSDTHKYIYHNIFSLALVSNLMYWIMVMLVTLVQSDVLNSEVNNLEGNHIFDVFSNGVLLIECALVILLFKPFHYRKNVLITLNILSAVVILFTVFTFLILEVNNSWISKVEVTLSILVQCLLITSIVLWGLYSIFSFKKFNNQSNKFNYGDIQFAKFLQSLLTIYTILLIIICFELIIRHIDVESEIKVVNILILLFLIGMLITTLIYSIHKRKKTSDEKVIFHRRFAILNFHFVFLIGYIIALALMSPNSPINISIVFPEAMYILLIAVTFAVSVLFFKIYLYRVRMMLLYTLLFVFILIGYYIALTLPWAYGVFFAIVTYLLYTKSVTDFKKRYPSEQFWHPFSLNLIEADTRTHKHNNILIHICFPLMLVVSLIVFNTSLPKPLLYLGDKSKEKPQKITFLGKKNDYIVVIAAQGGGIAASAWTAKVLEGLQKLSKYESADSHLHNFSDNIKAISAVSGGALGSYYYYVNLLNNEKPHINGEYSSLFIDEIKECQPNKNCLKNITSKPENPVYKMASRNSLKAIMWGIASPALVVPKETALVSRWVKKIRVGQDNEQFEVINENISNKLSSFIDEFNKDNNVYFIANSSYQETGRRAIISNYKFSNQDKNKIKDYDVVLDKKMTIKGINAVLHSATFPYITGNKRPLVYFESNGKKNNERHNYSSFCKENINNNAGSCYRLADGGYVDNYGVRSALDFIKDYNPKKVILLQIITFKQKTEVGFDDVVKTNLFGPITTINNLRSSQKEYNDDLINKIRDSGIQLKTVEFIYDPDNLKQKQLPLSWQLLPKHNDHIEYQWLHILWGYLHKKDESPITKLAKAIEDIKKGVVYPPKVCEICVDKCSCQDPIDISRIESKLINIELKTESILKQLMITEPVVSLPELLINCKNHQIFSSPEFIKGEPKIGATNIKKSFYKNCNYCSGSILGTLSSNGEQNINDIVKNDKIIWHILGLTSSDGSFSYNANLAERRIKLYESALIKSGVDKKNIIKHALGETISALETGKQKESDRRKAYLIACKDE